MMATRIVDVLVPVALDQAYSYRVPAGLEVAPGDIVVISFGACPSCSPQHIGIVSDRKGPRGLPLLIHNMGPAPTEDDTLDAWTQVADRRSHIYGWSMVLAGYGAPFFMFLAGIAMALASGARERKGFDQPQGLQAQIGRRHQARRRGAGGRRDGGAEGMEVHRFQCSSA